MLFLLISPALSNYLPSDLLEATTCKSYSCAPTSVSKKFANSCIYSPTGSSSVYLWTCPVDSTANWCNTTSGICQVPVSNKDQSYVGDACKLSSDCYLSTCIQGICRGLSRDKFCEAHEQCDIGLRCDSLSSTCKPQINSGLSGCRTYFDCVNWASCNATYSISNGVCVNYHSLIEGSVVSDCVNGFSYMCRSGYCIQKLFQGKIGVCANAPVSFAKQPQVCKSSRECVGYFDGKNVTSTCKCGFNAAGNSFCAPFIGDLPGVYMISSWKKALNLTGGCNTARRASESCLRSIGKLKNTTEASLGFMSYERYVNNDVCVKYIYNYQYWFSYGYALMFGVFYLII